MLRLNKLQRMLCIITAAFSFGAGIIVAYDAVKIHEIVPHYEESARIEGTVIYPTKSVSGDSEDLAADAYAMLPEEVRNSLMEDGFRLILVSRPDGDITNGGTRSGVYSSMLDIASVQTGKRYDVEIYGTITHEIGHHLDYCTYENRNISDDVKWNDLFREHKADLYTEFSCQYCINDSPKEGFAECFSLLCVYPDSFSKLQPEITQYLTELFPGFIDTLPPGWETPGKDAGIVIIN